MYIKDSFCKDFFCDINAEAVSTLCKSSLYRSQMGDIGRKTEDFGDI